MKIIADENLALTEYFFADIAKIEYRAGRQITNQDVHGADALLVRSVTKVNQALLYGTDIRFVGSATIGTDHVDLDYLQQQQIQFANAAGCNAQAVAEYVVTAILTLQPEKIHAAQNFCLGIIGLGNVGSRLSLLAKQLGWQVIAYDPYVQSTDIENVSFEQLLQQSDAISIHVPLTKTDRYPTYHLINQQAFALMKPHCILINSARGEVVQEVALLADITATKRQVVLDVFEHEPKVSKTLLDQLAIATPHIAGYSLEGKARGTAMVYTAFCQFFGKTADKDMTTQLQREDILFDAEQPVAHQLPPLLSRLYPIMRDDQALRACINANGWVEPQQFDQLRKNYPLRREWSAYGYQPLK